MHAYPARVSIGYVTTYSIPCICFGSLEFGMHAATIVIMPDKHMYVYIYIGCTQTRAVSTFTQYLSCVHGFSPSYQKRMTSIPSLAVLRLSYTRNGNRERGGRGETDPLFTSRLVSCPSNARVAQLAHATKLSRDRVHQLPPSS